MDDSRLRDFVEQRYSHVVGAVAMICGDVHAAEDAVQEALIKAFPRQDSIVSLEHWVLTVALNQVRSHFRRQGAEARAYLRVRRNHRASQEGPIYDDTVARCVQRLPARQREVVILHYVLDLRVEDISQLLGNRPGTVKALLHQARSAIRSALGDEEVSPDARC